MKKVIILISMLASFAGYSQTVGQFRYDSTKFLKVGGINFLIIDSIQRTSDTTLNKPLVINAGGIIRQGSYWPGGSGGGGTGIDTGAYRTIHQSPDSTYFTIRNLYGRIDTVQIVGDGSGGSAAFTAVKSIEKIGDSIYLKNDLTTPGANKVYGTDTLGVKGYQDLAVIDPTGAVDGYVVTYEDGGYVLTNPQWVQVPGQGVQYQYGVSVGVYEPAELFKFRVGHPSVFRDSVSIYGKTDLLSDVNISGVTTMSNKLAVIGSTSQNSIEAGTFGIQSYTTNNGWISDNAYFDGSVFRYRANGAATLLYFVSNGLLIQTATAGTAGSTITFTTKQRWYADGKVESAVYTDYADNAAALAGGLTAGMFYRTGDIVKQVH